MPGTDRLISDGEEMVLSAGDTFRIRPRSGSHGATERTGDPAGSKRVAIQYLGFRDVENRREYALRAQRGDHEGRYTVSIELAAFAKRQALLQDGPDICYQKLLHELSHSELQVAVGILVTESDLAAYRESHTPVKRSKISLPQPGEASKAAEGAGGAPAARPRWNP